MLALLQQLTLTNRARARYALRWRPRFLATLALSMSQISACRAARVAYNTVKAHRLADPDFAAQCLAAEEHAVELLHDVSMRSALEGDCEPVFWQGIQVGHIRKFDNRLRIEMLRAHMPDKFKTPGSKALVGGNVGNLIICGPEQLATIQAARREALEAMNPDHVETKAKVLSERTLP
jgi:hypothetical protein